MSMSALICTDVRSPMHGGQLAAGGRRGCCGRRAVCVGPAPAFARQRSVVHMSSGVLDVRTRLHSPRKHQVAETDQNRGRSTVRAPSDPPAPPDADHPSTDHAPEDCGEPDARPPQYTASPCMGRTTAAGSSGNKLISHGFGRSPSRGLVAPVVPLARRWHSSPTLGGLAWGNTRNQRMAPTGTAG